MSPNPRSDEPGFVRQRGDDVLVQLRVQPRARRTEVVGLLGDRLKIALCSPPVDGKANEELCRFLAGIIGVPKSCVSLVAGASARQKTVAVRGCDLARVLQALENA